MNETRTNTQFTRHEPSRLQSLRSESGMPILVQDAGCRLEDEVKSNTLSHDSFVMKKGGKGIPGRMLFQ